MRRLVGAMHTRFVANARHCTPLFIQREDWRPHGAHTGGEPPSLDLSVFGTPAGISDEAISQGWNVENFAYTNVDKVTEFGRFEQRLPHSTVMFGKRVCHVYLYVEVSRSSAAFYAIFAKDGHVVKQLQNTPFDKVFQDGELTAKRRRYRNVDLDVVRLKQVARPESLIVVRTTTRVLGIKKSAIRSHHLSRTFGIEQSTI